LNKLSIFNVTQNTTIADKGAIADSFMSRMVGLLNKKSLENGEALIITKCQSIHMFFMKFAIDVIFIDKNDCVVGLVANINPNRLSPIFLNSKCAIETPAGVITQSGTSIGDQIRIDN